ncbi:MAG: hypothetical protein GX432_04545 [Candidatus Atribacteria bacterium]|nr:hypothetical protein [Candidatus Atribacteria bacterium]
MGKKTIYIRDEDEKFFKQAMKKLGKKEGLGSILIKALKEKLQDNNKLIEEAYELIMLRKTDLNKSIDKAIYYYLYTFPSYAREEAEVMVKYIDQEFPEYFSLEGDNRLKILNAMWYGDKEWFEGGKKLLGKLGIGEYAEESKMENFAKFFDSFTEEKLSKPKGEQPIQTKESKKRKKQKKGG